MLKPRVVVLAEILLILFLINNFFKFCIVEGESMWPTFSPKKRILVVKNVDFFVGSVVRAIDNEGSDVIKRIKWIKGDKVFLVGGNPNDSIDSRQLGAVSKNQILGVVYQP